MIQGKLKGVRPKRGAFHHEPIESDAGPDLPTGVKMRIIDPTYDKSALGGGSEREKFMINDLNQAIRKRETEATERRWGHYYKK